LIGDWASPGVSSGRKEDAQRMKENRREKRDRKRSEGRKKEIQRN
jgi:hypothetical protein